MLALGIDTSNYATSLAVVDTSRREVVSYQKIFLPVAQGEKGLRQSDAVFHHTKALPQVLANAAAEADLRMVQVVGVSEKPRPQEGSYMPCFLPGVAFAQAFSAGRDVPLHHTTHQQGHLAAALFGARPEISDGKETLFFHVSGGTTELLLTNGYTIKETVCQSLDLFAGQAIDRLGVAMGFPFPAGEHVSALAAQCRESVKVPKIVLQDGNCHLSGLENQCNAMLEQEKPREYVVKHCLAFVAETLRAMIGWALERHANASVLCAGGVLCSELVRDVLHREFDQISFAPPRLSADNAVGVALAAAKANT